MTTILIADDDARVRLLLRAILGEHGHSVVEAADGDAALAAIRAQRPTVAILDVDMPLRSGLDVCRALRADPDLAGTGVVIISADAAEVEAAAAGASAFLAKPFSPRQLLAMVDELAPSPDATPLRALRAERLLSIRELARRAGVASSTIYLTEAGRTVPQPSVMRRIAAALEVDPRHVAEF